MTDASNIALAGSSTQSIGTADGTSVRKASTAETEEPMPSVSGVRAPSGMQAGSAGRRAEVLTLEVGSRYFSSMSPP